MYHHHFSDSYFQLAQEFIPGGVNSPVRACRSVGCNPIFIERSDGCYLYDVDGNRYIDYISSWGPMILGHVHPEVKAAIAEALESGTSFGIPTWREVALAKKIVEFVPSIEQVRLVNSGTEATMSAIRLARGYTGKNKILKFDGCYHGHADSFLIKAGSGVATLGIPGSPGVPKEVVESTLAVPYNDLKALKSVLDRESDEMAAVIVEPVAANMGVVPPRDDFLPKLRTWTQERGILLIFDEVITGFRLARGGAQEYFQIMPDITCLGKIIGGGLPVGAYGGRREIMEKVAPVGPVYQAGTLSGNPLATAAGLATLEVLDRPGVYEVLEERAEALQRGLVNLARHYNVACCPQRLGSMMTTFFGQRGPVTNFETVLKSDTDLYARFFRHMLARGVYFAPSQFEAGFVSLAHGWEVIEETLRIADSVFKAIA
ncbi:MAG: glutamate-1-semialdehyde 2,1-aminomutase [Nitrospiraceae bacterium]|nr:glutamate-1-semialdehyde 2,1-aminomutase [Nitrospiraceae bacterium]